MDQHDTTRMGENQILAYFNILAIDMFILNIRSGRFRFFMAVSNELMQLMQFSNNFMGCQLLEQVFIT